MLLFLIYSRQLKLSRGKRLRKIKIILKRFFLLLYQIMIRKKPYAEYMLASMR